MSRVVSVATLDSFSEQERFNWGYHDAQTDADFSKAPRDMSRHFDRFYAAGYRSRWAEVVDGVAYTGNSLRAWLHLNVARG